MKVEDLRRAMKEAKASFIIKVQQTKEREYKVDLSGKRRTWSVCLSFSNNFPFCLPTATLLDTDLIGVLPHVNSAGTICVEESDSVLVDYARPVAIIKSYLEDALRILERVSLKIYHEELFEEVEGYFVDAKKVNSFYFARESVERISLRIGSTAAESFASPVLLFGKGTEPPNEFSSIERASWLQIISIVHLPLKVAIIPPANGEKITPDFVHSIKTSLSGQQEKQLCKLLQNESAKRYFFLLLSMPRDSGERTQLLLRFTSHESRSHPMTDSHCDWNITPYLINRHNREYLLERGGANKSLLDKKIAVIGCGSVGSEVTALLSKAGVGEFTLIDHDFLEADNIYRHRLGGASLNFAPSEKGYDLGKMHKVIAMSAALKIDLPFIKVNAKPSSFNNLAESKCLLAADLIIVAVGSPSTSLSINKRLKSLGIKNVIFCWNEAGGYGGHSVSIDLFNSCLECLYTNEGGFSMVCELSLLEAGQDISKNLTGCGGVFTPFSYLDSAQTAALAANHTIDHLLNGRQSVALTWKGAGQGELRVTARYDRIPVVSIYSSQVN